jgi:flagellar basal body-associated protein FliL
MKNWLAKNKGLTIILVIVVMVLLVAVVAGPSIWSAILAAHGL